MRKEDGEEAQGVAGTKNPQFYPKAAPPGFVSILFHPPSEVPSSSAVQGTRGQETAQMSLAQDKSLAVCQLDTAHGKKDRLGEPSAWTFLGYYCIM